MPSLKKNKKVFFFSFAVPLLFIFFAGIFFLVPEPASAAVSLWEINDTLAGWVQSGAKSLAKGAMRVVGNPFLWVFNILLYGVSLLIWLLLFLAGILFDWAVNPENFALVVNSKSVLVGWTIVRDALNLAFILVLLFSAFATIFQVEKFHLKKILLTLVLMALLVNFSYPISRFIIDAGNVPMYYLISTAFPNSTNASGFSAQITNMSQISDLIGSTSSDWEKFATPEVVTVRLLFEIIFGFIFMITMFVIGILLIIRIVVLAILIIFAPIGFVAAILPSTKGFADQWWEQLFKQTFFGVVMIFSVVLALKIGEETKASLQAGFGALAGRAAPGGVSTSNYSSLIVTGATMTIPLVILWVGIISAQKIGAAGASAVVGQASRFAKWSGRNLTGYRAAKWGIGRFGHKLDRDIAQGKFLGLGGGERMRKIGRWLSPTAIKKGFEERAKRHDEEAYGSAAGGVHDTLNKLFRDKEPEGYYEGLAKDRLTASKKKQLNEVTEVSKRLVSMIAKDIGSDDEAAVARVRAVFESVIKNKDADEFFDFVKKNYDKPILAGGKSFQDLGIAQTVSNHNFGDAMRKILGASGMDKNGDEMKEIVGDLGEFGVGMGSVGGYGTTYFDDESGKFEWIENHPDVKSGKVSAKEQQAIFTMKKLMTSGEAQAVPKIFHRNLLVDDEENGRIDEEAFHAFVSSGLAENILPHANRFRPDFTNRIMENESKFQDYINSGKFKDPHDREAAQAFLHAIRDYTRGEFKVGSYKIPTPRGGGNSGLGMP